MLCNWNRWRISKALDTGSPLPRSLERHLLGCEACREYHRFCNSLPHKGQTDLSTLVSTDTKDLSTRVLAGLDRAGDLRSEQKRRSPLRIPAFSAAVTVTALILGFILLRPPASPDLSQLNPLAEWRNVESTLSGLVKSMDSPYRTELKNLRSSLNTTADFFRSFLDIRLGEEE